MLELRGIVDSGQHLAGAWASEDPLVAAILGTALHPGSINIFVPTFGCPELSACRHPFFSQTVDESVDPREIRRRGVLLVRDCTVNGHPAFILRTEHPGRAYDGPDRSVPTRLPQPNTMFEVFASYLPWVTYGADATLKFDPRPEALRRLRTKE